MSTEQYQEALKGHNIGFTVKNIGVHLIVEGTEGFIDVWPTTGKWTDRTRGDTGFGLYALLARIVAPSAQPRHTVELSHTTAVWLKGTMQNPLWTSPENESEEDSRARKEIWDALKDVQL